VENLLLGRSSESVVTVVTLSSSESAKSLRDGANVEARARHQARKGEGRQERVSLIHFLSGAQPHPPSLGFPTTPEST
jgi:hypothetical protein